MSLYVTPTITFKSFIALKLTYHFHHSSLISNREHTGASIYEYATKIQECNKLTQLKKLKLSIKSSRVAFQRQRIY